MNMSDPFFTIITATFNAAATLPRLLGSLAGQSCRDFELVIQDGASQDRTLAILEAYRHRLPGLDVVSEPDQGIYDAWNKALGRINGQWVIFLGADDSLVDAGILDTAKKKLLALPDSAAFASGDVIVCDDEKELGIQQGLGEDAVQRLRSGSPAMHSGLFQRARVFALGGFDTSFTITGDHDFVVRHWAKASDGVRLGLPVTRMDIGGATSSLRNVLLFRYEFARVMRKHFGLKGALPYLPGVCKGLIPFALFKMFGPEKALRLYNILRATRGLPPASTR